MRLTSTLWLLLAPTLVHAQTIEIQRRVETKLWFQRVLEWIEAAVGMPPAIALSTFFSLLLAIVASLLWWNARRKRSD